MSKTEPTEKFGIDEIRRSWWGPEQTTVPKSTCFTDEERKRLYGTEFFFFGVPWNFHWILAIVCFAGKCVDDKLFPGKEPRGFFFDSLIKTGRFANTYKKSDMTLGNVINSFLNSKFSTTKFTRKTMPFFECKVPQQSNEKDCGVCALEFAGFFMRNPNVYYNLLRNDPSALKDWLGKQQTDFPLFIWKRRKEYYEFLTDGKASVEGFRERFVDVQNAEVEALILAAYDAGDKNPGF